MTSFLDWLSIGDPNASADELTKRYRLSQDEMRRAADALAPAFIIGLQRLASDTAAWTALMAEFFKGGATPLSGGTAGLAEPTATRFANAFFGSDALAKAVAGHASTMSGIAPDTMMKMLPSFSVMTVQATMRLLNPALFDPKAFPTDPAGATISEMLRRSANAVDAFNRPSDSGKGTRTPTPPFFGMDEMFAGAMRAGFPWMGLPATTETAERASRTPSPFDPFGAIGPVLELFTRSIAAPRPAEEKVTPATQKDRREKDPILQMIETGQAAQAQYAREVMSLFEKHDGPRK